MEVTIDKYGRIVIPKPVRERLGLESGAALELTVERAEGGDALTLRPIRERRPLVWEDGVLIHRGVTDELLDPTESVRQTREERTRRLTGAGPS